MLNSLDLTKPPRETRVVVAMSGGVDSSVVAALMAEAGYDVVGVTLQLYDHGAASHRKGACCAGQDIHDARRVAEKIGIPHYVLDYEERFRTKVIDRFAASYANGETPIPCVDCNQHVKFTDLLDTARDLGADVLATGHYVDSRALDDGSRALFRPVDADRDQSYFLFATTRDQLSLLRFPLGTLTKAETRAHAHRLGLSVADKADSQDICFVPSGHYSSVVERLRPEAAEPGDIVHLDGRLLGRHQGILRYTVGQRRGLGIAAREPLYVVRLDAARRHVVVGPKEALETRDVALRDFNWIGDDQPGVGTVIDCFAKVRSTRSPKAAQARFTADGVTIELLDGEEGVAPGQACVLYDSAEGPARVLGGGFIMRAAVSAPLAAPALSLTL
ncbi:MAG: tRNA 2-thiouridine(34) synthase MnmA [Alphaproteobacteria bacterium]